MRLYLDTSVLVSALSKETAAHRVLEWLSVTTTPLVVSDWAVTEFSSALSLKIRSRLMTSEERADAAAAFRRMTLGALDRIGVVRAHFDTAAQFAERHISGLRGGDALHLAICADQAFTLCTLDRRLAAAGPSLGVATRLL